MKSKKKLNYDRFVDLSVLGAASYESIAFYFIHSPAAVYDVTLFQCWPSNIGLTRWPSINPFKPEFTIVIFIPYKPWIAVAILDL